MWAGWPCMLTIRMQSEVQGSDLSSVYLTLGIDLKQKLHMLKSPNLIYCTHSGFSSIQGA